MKGPKPNEDGIIIHIVNDRFCDSCGEINGEKEFFIVQQNTPASEAAG